jgi:hypothetical protein
LREAMRRHGGRDGGDAGCAHTMRGALI